MTSSKERIKSFLLVALVLSSVVLTQINLFDGLNISEGISEAREFQSTKLSAYINPQSYFVSFGGLSYTKVYDDRMQDQLWTEIRPFILSSLLNYESIDEITKADFVKAFADRSLMVRMPLDLTASRFYSVFSDEGLSDDVAEIEPYEYLLREGSVRSLYVFDKNHDKYYLLRHKSAIHDIKALIDAVKSEAPIEYRKISDRFSLDSTVGENFNKLNYELIPYEYDFIIGSLNVENEVRLDEINFSSDISSISSAVFGESMDFVKRLKDVNDSIILMYGYGEKSLTVSHDGLISYRKKFDPNLANTANFKEAFSLSSGFIENFGIIPDGLFLAYYEEIKSENTFIFYYSYKLNSYVVGEVASRQYPIKVVVKENQVVSVDKNVKLFTGEMSMNRFSNVDRLMTVDQCIVINDVEVSVYYLQDNNRLEAQPDKNAYYFEIRSDITSLELRYLETLDDNVRYMVPMWQVIISGRTYLFNAYDGKLLGTYR